MYRSLPSLLSAIAWTVCLAQQPTPWDAPPEARKLKNKVSLTGDKMDAVGKLYLDKCASCHGVKGNSNGPDSTTLAKEPADFTNVKMMRQLKDGELFWKISTGRSPMPSYGTEVSDTDRWQLVNYVRYLTERSQYRYLGVRRTPGR